MAILALLYGPVLMIFREWFDTVQTMTDQTILSPLQGVREGWLAAPRCNGGFGFGLRLVAKQAGVQLPRCMIFGKWGNGVCLVAGKALIFVIFYQVWNLCYLYLGQRPGQIGG